MTGGQKALQHGAFELPVRINIHPSRWLAMALAIIHAGALLILLIVHLDLSIKLLVILAIILSFLNCFYIHIWRKSSHSIVELVLNERDEWLLIRRDGQVLEPRLRSGAYVHPYLVILPFQYGWYFTTVILTPGTVDKDTLRRLRVRLRYKKQQLVN